MLDFLHPSQVELEVDTPCRQRQGLSALAPAEEAGEVRLGVDSGLTLEVRQEAGDRQLE